MSETINISRNSILINSRLNYKRRKDLESPQTCNIWIEISIDKGKKLLLMGGYETWASLKCRNIENGKSNVMQMSQFKITLDNWSLAMKEGKDVVVCMDDNIDSSTNNRHNKKFNITNIYNKLIEHLNTHSITQCNSDYTRTVSHQQPSCIDKIYTNSPNKITNLKTKNNIHSDHKYLVARFLTKEPSYTPKFFLKRDYTNLTKFNINDYINRSTILNDIFSSQDSDFIAEAIQIELNSIYNALAPGEIVKYRNNYIPYHNHFGVHLPHPP